jgi:MoxR-like ATPase
LLALFCRENIVIIGPPGTAKTLVAERIAKMIGKKKSYFYALLNRFSTPEELFGPISITQLKQDKLIRKTKGFLPQSTVSVLDEIFKASTAILNCLLKVLNERKFSYDGEEESIPLQLVIAASNECPQSGLTALYDRFLIRKFVNRLG